MFSLAKIGEELTRNGNRVHFLISKDVNLVESKMVEPTSTFQVERFGSTKVDNELAADYDEVMESFTRSLWEKKSELKDVFSRVQQLIVKQTKALLNDNDALIDRLDKEQFDMAVIDSMFFAKYAYLIPLRLGVPWVTCTDVLTQWIVKVPYLPSFVPARQRGGYSERMTFTERLVNTIFDFVFFSYLGVSEPPEEVVKNYRKYGNFSTMDDLIYKSLLFITTTDHILDYAKPTMPNIIHAAGLTATPSKKQSLPDDISNFIAGAKKGVVLITFGSMASKFPPEMANKFLSAFQRLGSDYRILFRFDNKDNLTIPENVLISPWLPQNDILADPRVRLFITHCGNNGQYEALYHAIPMVAFPLVGDQPYNAKRLEYKGFGIIMDIYSFTIEGLYKNMRTILTDQSYKDRVQHAADIFKSAKETRAERAAYWVEHVTKFGGEHLRSAGSDLPLYQYLMLDILFVITLTVTSFLVCVWKMVKVIFRKCFYKPEKKSTKKKHE